MTKYILTLVVMAMISLTTMASSDTTVYEYYRGSIETEYRVKYEYDPSPKKNVPENAYLCTVTVEQKIVNTNRYIKVGSPMMGWFPGMYRVISQRHPNVWVKWARANKKGLLQPL